MDSKFLVSVVMPVYNAENYLKESVESILSQTYKNIEFIIINDGSTDGGLEIIKKYASKDERVVLIDREKKGLVASLNEGVKASKGKYIVRMDADDISLPSRVEKQVSYMEKNLNVGVCGTAVKCFGSGGREFIRKYPTKDAQLKTNLLFSPPFAHPSVAIRKSVLIDNNLLYDKKYLHAEDYGLWSNLEGLTSFANLKEALLKYRVGHSSVTSNADKNKNQRMRVLGSIYGKYLTELGLIDKQDKVIHFNLTSNARIKESKLNFKDLKRYFDKVTSANRNQKLLDKSSLSKLLGRKWLINLYYKPELKAIFSKYFLFGMWGMLFY